MKSLRFWIATGVAIVVITTLVIWTQNLSARPWITILVWASVIILLQLMFVYLIVFKNHHK